MSQPPTDGASPDSARQDALLSVMGTPAFYGMTEPVTRMDTHGAIVFLVGEDAWKVKRAVRFPFLDYGTLERRHAACEEELAVNRPCAPEIYLGVVPITRTSSGGFELAGSGETVEWAVHMRRFDQADMLDAVAERGGLTPDLLKRLARAVLRAHVQAPKGDGARATDSLARYIEQNDTAWRADPELFPPYQARELTARARAMFVRLRPALVARGTAGHVRRGHGDLHLRNIVLWHGEPTLFDAIEFDPDIATGDVLYDLAFLLMDLWDRGHDTAANMVLNRYLSESREEAHLPALAFLPFFMSLRAAIRAKVTAANLPHLSGLKAEKGRREARAYFDLALSLLSHETPQLIAIGGLSGAGKSRLSADLAPHVGGPPGAIHLRSDVERKALFGVEETERLPAEAYTAEVTERIYAQIIRKAGLVLGAGRAVIVDAVSGLDRHRDELAEAARRAGAPFKGLWLDAPLPVLLARVAGRRGDASDATADIVLQQASTIGPVEGWTRVDASGSPRETLARAVATLALDEN